MKTPVSCTSQQFVTTCSDGTSVSRFPMFYVVENTVCMVYPLRCALFIKFVFKKKGKKIKNKTNKCILVAS